MRTLHDHEIDGLPRAGDTITTNSEDRTWLETIGTDGLAQHRLLYDGGGRRGAIAILKADDLFTEAKIGELLGADGPYCKATAERRFDLLNSGHGIVLLTTTRLVELVDERRAILCHRAGRHGLID